MSGRDDVGKIADAVRERFEAQKRVLSFDEYVELVQAHPRRFTRDAARYLRDAFDHYGTYEVDRPWGATRRFRLFDLDFDTTPTGRRRRDHLVGHERIQERVHRQLENFVREGRANRLILLHGPNGSAKSTFVHTLMRALEHFSTLDEGALYRFSWIFPRGRDGKTIGFGSADDPSIPGRSFAHLPDAQVDVKLPSEIREHPLMLLPLGERRALIEAAYERGKVSDAAPDLLWNGQLGHKNQQILQALLTAYRGDLMKVLGHVQVERYYVSRRYRVAAVTIGPQMAVDAHERQITADRTLNALPASLASLTLFEPYGELVDGSGGVVEYSDLLKRPLDAWKYLLLAIEDGEVALPLSNLPINAVLVASSNEVHLGAFKEHHEYNSFRGRIQLVRVPYLLDYRDEQAIYASQIVPQVRRHVAPHAIYCAALWAVLTRLRRAQPDHYESSSLGRIAADLAPIEKAELYATGALPRRLSTDESRELLAGIRVVQDEWESAPEYEGLSGASPREIRTLLLEAANDAARTSLSPLGVLERLEAFCARDDYDFLKQSPDRGYHDHRAFVRVVHGRWLDRVDDEVRSSTGLVEEARHEELFVKYVLHVSTWVKKEKLYNSVTGGYEDPDAELMRTVEEKLDVEDEAEEFRRNLIGAIASHAIDHPGAKIDPKALFPRYVDKLREGFFGERRHQIAAVVRDILTVLDDGTGLPRERLALAETTLRAFLERFGYEKDSAREAIGELLRERYSS